MKDDCAKDRNPSRRGFLFAAGGAAAATVGLGAGAVAASDMATPPPSDPRGVVEPFWGAHQGGILTLPQSHSYFAAFDIATDQRAAVEKLLRDWTVAAARLANGEPVEPISMARAIAAVAARRAQGEPVDPDYESDEVRLDSGETAGMLPARLTVTFGFGPSLFVKDGKDRFGLAARRPEALIDLPRFNGDQLKADLTGGDLSVQACADDPQVAFHAVRQLVRLAYGVAQVRWAQAGFLGSPADPAAPPRNLMGFKDGTNNLSTRNSAGMDKFIWVAADAPDWMRGGSYLVARRIRIALEHWDRMKLAFQEQTIGRHKMSGAPIGKAKETDDVELDRVDKDGNPIIPENAHIRLAAPANNDGTQILRRGYSYNDGVNFTAERWPPWRQGMEYDAGLFFLCYQGDPRSGFVKIFERMSKFDMMNQFVTHTGSGIFACPGGAAEGGFIGERLFSA
jgi:deferrochelatase/peroxidase EfeB